MRSVWSKLSSLRPSEAMATMESIAEQVFLAVQEANLPIEFVVCNLLAAFGVGFV